MKDPIMSVRRMGAVPFWRGERRIKNELEDIYRKAAGKAATALSLQKLYNGTSSASATNSIRTASAAISGSTPSANSSTGWKSDK